MRGWSSNASGSEEAAEEAATLLARTELLHDELLSRWEQQRQQSAELQEQRRQQLERSIRQGQNEVRRIIRRLRQGAPGGGHDSTSLGRPPVRPASGSSTSNGSTNPPPAPGAWRLDAGAGRSGAGALPG